MSVFTPRSFSEIEQDFTAMVNQEVQKHSAKSDFEEFKADTPTRAAQLTFIKKLIATLNESPLDDTVKASILTAALLDVKRQILDSYNTLLSRWTLSPTRSFVFTQIDKIVGLPAENPSDTVEDKVAVAKTLASMHTKFKYFMADNAAKVFPAAGTDLLKFDLTIPRVAITNAEIEAAAKKLKPVVLAEPSAAAAAASPSPATSSPVTPSVGGIYGTGKNAHKKALRAAAEKAAAEKAAAEKALAEASTAPTLGK